MGTKMGRPIKGDVPKDERIGLRISKEEKEKILLYAEKECKSCSEFILDAVWEYIKRLG